MKKMNLKTIALITVSAIALTGCGSAEDVFTDPSQLAEIKDQIVESTAVDPADAESAMTIFNFDMKDYVDVGDYLNLNVTYEETEISNEYIDYAYESFIKSYTSAVEDSDLEKGRAVVNGDIVKLDYSGKVDGEAFEGGTATGYILEIGSGIFIPGFEDGLVGVMPGEEVDLDLTFPEEYKKAELAGKDVTFTCTVQGIITIDSIINTANKHLEEGQEPLHTEDDIRDLCRTELIKQAAQVDRNDVENQIAQELSTIITEKQELPAELQSAYDNLVLKSLNNAAEYYNTDPETLLSQYEMTVDDYVAQYSKTQLINDAALYVIAEENGLLLSEDQLDSRIAEYKVENEIPDEELYKQLSREEYRVFFMELDVIEFLADYYMQK